MSDRKRKAAICCLIAASLLALERRKKRKLEYGENESDSLEDSDSTSDVDEENEEPNYETSDCSNIAIKVEPGLVDEDVINGYQALKEDVKDPLDISDMVDIETTGTIKQESYNYENSLDGSIRIKEEPVFSDEDGNCASPQNYLSDSSEGCSQSKVVSFDAQREMTAEKEREVNKAGSSSELKDECQVFGDFVAEGMRNLKKEYNRKKLKRIIQNVLVEISKSECLEN